MTCRGDDTTGQEVGSSPHRVGGIGRVTGRQRYLADIHPPGELHAKLVTVDAARARIVSIDTRAALGVPGVRLVLTAADLPQPVPRFGPQTPDRPVLAVGETKFHGEPVAAVAAETKDAATLAARLVRVEYEKLPAVVTIAEALDPTAPLVQDPALRPGDPLAQTNVFREHRFGWGDVDGAGAHVVIENAYTFPMVTHFAIEPHGFMAAPEGEDGLTIWSTMQHPFMLQQTIAAMFDLALSKVRVHAPDPGGGFGGKQHAKLEPLVAFMARRAGRPVRLVLTLDETFQAVRRAAAEIRVRTGLSADGTIVSQEIESDFLAGAYVDTADRVVTKASYLACGPYRVPNARIVARTVLSHTTPSTACRGVGTPQLTWARELNLDEGARALGIDPVELRLRNLARHDEAFVPGDTPADGRWEETLTRAAELIGWTTPTPPGRGRGIAVGVKAGPTYGLSRASVRLLADASAVVMCGTSDMGQGARTVFAQVAARELGIPVDRIAVVMGDTAVIPFDRQTSASRSTVMMGTAVQRACHEIHQQVAAMACRLHDVDPSQVEVSAGIVHLADRRLPLVDVARAGLGRLGGEIVGDGELRKDTMPEHPIGGTALFYEFNATAVEVVVDRGTGRVTVVRHVCVGDAGTALNPTQVAGQDEGAAVMGLGHTLMEHIILDEEGRIRNLGAIDYRIPTSMDLPLELITATIENDDGPGPYGAKGLSEGAILATAPAVAAAVRDATGITIRDLPLTPQRVWEALTAAG
jgi:CO/xanthine dehydrogenase Mo-binding subunit